jgi:FixJ family two-component response regulator
MILVIDDDIAVRTSLLLLLKSQKYEVEVLKHRLKL